MPKPKFTPHPQSALGDFYVIQNECVTCGVPHVVAPELMAWTEDGYHCFWKKQPETEEEFEHAILVLEAQEFGCHRYAGLDPRVLKRVPQYCDDLPRSAGRKMLRAIQLPFLSNYGRK